MEDINNLCKIKQFCVKSAERKERETAEGKGREEEVNR